MVVVAVASSIVAGGDPTGERVILGLLNLRGRSPGDCRAPSVQIPYAFFKEA